MAKIEPVGNHMEYRASRLSKIARSLGRTQLAVITTVSDALTHLREVPVERRAPQVRKSQKWQTARVSAFYGRAQTIFSAAFIVTVGMLFVNAIDPYSGATASPYYQPAVYFGANGQEILVGGSYANSAGRDGISLGAAAALAAATAPSAGIPDPDSAQAIAYGMVTAHGWGQEQFNCLVALWNRESHWRVEANNTGSGAYGIPQALPGSKMASAGADWQTNPATQITWGLGYIAGRYGTPCGAWAHSEALHWY